MKKQVVEVTGLVWFMTQEKNRYKMSEYSYRDGGKWYVNISLCEGQPDRNEFIVASGKTLNEACENLKQFFYEKMLTIEPVGGRDKNGNKYHVGSLSDLDIQDLVLQFEKKIREKRKVFLKTGVPR